MKTLIKERPLPFSPDMVLATLRGWKTQTSRTLGLERFNNPPEWPVGPHGDTWEICYFLEEKPGRWLAISNDETGEFPGDFDPWVKCPYGKTGDRLWVREPWKVGAWQWCEPYIAVDYISDGYIRKEWLPVSYDVHTRLVRQSMQDFDKSGVRSSKLKYWEPGEAPTRVRQAMFMPRTVSRILLEITDIKIKRLKRITWREAEAEGIEQIFYDEETSVTGWKNYLDPERMCCQARDSFFTLWDCINGAGASEKDPWVWMIKFKVLEIKE